jgi:peptide/nickel transport system substrate-binding protein
MIGVRGPRAATLWSLVSFCLASLFVAATPSAALELVETPMFAERVAAGELPPVSERVPTTPRVIELSAEGLLPGRHGGDLRTLGVRSKDVRLLVVYGYARLVGYHTDFGVVADIAQSVTVDEGRVFTIKLRPGHKWSDGHPFTSEDFRYFWEDVATNEELRPSGPPREMIVDGEPARVEILDQTTIRYSWSQPNPFFLPALARAAPLFIYRPSHYMKAFHLKYADPAELAERAAAEGKRNWAALHNRMDNLYKFDNPDQPTLQPWCNTTVGQSIRFIGERNPYYHRIDENGRQLPYIDRFILTIADSKIIPGKAGAGETDLQSRSLFFNNYTFLKEGEKRNDYTTLLWQTARGAHLALYPNLNINDEGWRAAFRDVRVRRAPSMAIDRGLINQVLYFGLAIEGNNTVLPGSSLFKSGYQSAWADYNPDAANELLDEAGLSARDDSGVRLLPDGRPMEVIVETAGEDTEQTDVLELVRDNWAEIGIKLYTRPSQREVFRNRIYAGETQVSIWSGLENGLPTPDMSPEELAPTRQNGLQWPKWGQYHESNGNAGEAPDMPAARELMDLHQSWLRSATRKEREKIWHRMLEIHREQTFSIGIVSGVMQPIVVNNRLRNVPRDAVYNWDPGAQFGIYRPDTFWYDEAN